MNPRTRELCFPLLLSGMGCGIAWANEYWVIGFLFAALSTFGMIGMMWSK
jgi:hypothetical protein